MNFWRNRIAYGFLLLFFVGVFLVFQTYGILVILLFLLFLPFLSLLLCRLSVEKLSMGVHTTTFSLEKGQEFPVEIVLKNGSILPILDCAIKVYVSNEFMGEEKNYEIHVPLYAKGSQSTKLTLQSTYCGVVRIQINQIVISDFLGMFSIRHQEKVQSEITHFPKIRDNIEIDGRSYVSGAEEEEESSQKGSDFQEVSEVREYIPGDSLKDIHWKLSAKKEELMVKEHVSLSSRQIAMLIELYNNSEQILDGVMEYAFSAGISLIHTGMYFTVFWWSEKQKCMKKHQITTVEQWEKAFHEIFFESAYPNEHYGFEQLKYEKEHPAYVIVMNQKDGFSYCECN